MQDGAASEARHPGGGRRRGWPNRQRWCSGEPRSQGKAAFHATQAPGGGRCLGYRPGGRHFKYRPPCVHVSRPIELVWPRLDDPCGDGAFLGLGCQRRPWRFAETEGVEDGRLAWPAWSWSKGGPAAARPIPVRGNASPPLGLRRGRGAGSMATSPCAPRRAQA